MLTKKEAHEYKKLILKKLEESGIQDQTVMKVSKLIKVANPEYKKPEDGGSTDPKENPEHVLIPRYQASRMIRQIYKKLLQSDRQTIQAFLRSDLSALKPKPAPAPTSASAEPKPLSAKERTKLLENFKASLLSEENADANPSGADAPQEQAISEQPTPERT